MYEGVITSEFLTEALLSLKDYKRDKEPILQLQRDNERLYRSWHNKTFTDLNNSLTCSSSLVFSAIENAVATASENYPSPNILEREEDGAGAAAILSKIIPAVLDICNFKRTYKANMRNKNKYGTAVYCVTCNEETENIDIRIIDFCDVFCDMHVEDVQESKFLFIQSAVDNAELKKAFPDAADMFCGNAMVDSLDSVGSYTIRNATLITDCYYKKDGALHLMKLCGEEIIAATEDMPGYENGLYEHGLYPVVFDVLYPIERCPFGFGMIDISKSTHVQIEKLDRAITENIMCTSKPRYLAKRNGGIDETEFKDLSKNIVHYEGDTEALKPVQGNEINSNALNHRDVKKDEVKEILGNRDFQQGQTSGGVQAASAIQILVQAGEKRTRLMSDDTYDSYKIIVYMVIELIRQFYTRPRTFRTTDVSGRKTFVKFSNDMLYKHKYKHGEQQPAEYDIDVTPQRENPFTREAFNNTILTLYNSGMLDPNNYASASIAISCMQFDGKELLLDKLQDAYNKLKKEQEQAQQAQQAQQMQAAAGGGNIDVATIPEEDMTQQASLDDSQLVPLQIGGV